MPAHTAAEKEKNRQIKSTSAISKLDAAEQGKPKKKPAKKKPAPVEKRGVGRDDSNANADRLGKQMREAIAREKANGNLVKVENLKSRLKQLEATRTK